MSQRAETEPRHPRSINCASREVRMVGDIHRDRDQAGPVARTAAVRDAERT